MRNLIYTLLLSFLVTFLSAQEQRNVDEINALYTQYFYATIDTAEIQHRQFHFDEFVTFLNKVGKKVKGKKREKELQYIFDEVQREYFLKYENNPSFYQVFTDGIFNCVTASAYFSLVFEYFDIPYDIIQEPTHVYIVAYPHDLNIIVESTIPHYGIIQQRAKKVESLKRELIDKKVITEAEGRQENFWQKHVIRDSIISTTQLNGLQYYNKALHLVEQEDFIQALDFLEKADSKHDSKLIDELYGYSIIATLEKRKYNDVETNCKLIGHYLQLQRDEEDLYNDVMYLVSTIVRDRPIANNPHQLEHLSNCTTLGIKDDVIRYKVTNVIDILISECYSNMTKIDSAIYYIEKSFDPDNEVAYAYIAYVVSKDLFSFKNSDEFLRELDKYEASFPFIINHDEIQTMGVYHYMYKVYTSYESNDAKSGLAMLEKFKAKYNPNGDFDYDPQVIGMGFGAASSRQVRLNNYTKAKSILNDGLKYCADSFELKRKLSLLK